MFFANSVFVTDQSGELVVITESISEAAAVPSVDVGAALIQMLLCLVGFGLLLFVTGWFFKKLWIGRHQKGQQRESILVLEKKMLSPKTMLYLVEFENKKILLSESHLEIKKLAELSDLSAPVHQEE